MQNPGSSNNKVLDGASMNLIVMHVGDIHVQQYGLSLLLAAHPFDTDLVYLG